MKYVIVRTDGMFVSRPGSLHSYTKYLQKARVYRTREAAEADRASENEQVRSVESCMEEM